MNLFNEKYLDMCDTISMSSFKSAFKKKKFSTTNIVKTKEHNGSKKQHIIAIAALNLSGDDKKYTLTISSDKQEIVQPPNTIYIFGCDDDSIIIDKFGLTDRPSNLGIGKVWYMVCPYTSELCRKLYYHGGHYYSRHVFNRKRYDIQRKSKKCRALEKYFSIVFLRDEWSVKPKKWHKTFYRGKMTFSEKRIVRRCEKNVEYIMSGRDKLL